MPNAVAPVVRTRPKPAFVSPLGKLVCCSLEFVREAPVGSDQYERLNMFVNSIRTLSFTLSCPPRGNVRPILMFSIGRRWLR